MQRRPRLSLTKLGRYLPCEHSALGCRATLRSFAPPVCSTGDLAGTALPLQSEFTDPKEGV